MKEIRRFRTHIEILKHNHPDLVIELVLEPADTPVELSLTDGIPVLKWNGKSLHSSKSPEGEARRFLEAFRMESGRAYTVFGVGLGHLAASARERLPDRAALILIEPDIRILREALSAVDLRALLFDERISWVSGKNWMEQYRSALRRHEESGRRASTAILSLPSYRTYFSRLLSESRSILAQFINERDIDAGTRMHLWDLWNQNLTDNLEDILASAPVRYFTTTFDKIPAVLVGAGPSLDHQLQDLNRLKSGALMIAVDTALAPLLSAGCTPDIVLAMDAQEENARDFANLPPHTTTLLFDAFCCSKIPKLYPPAARVASVTGHLLEDLDETVVVHNGLLPMLEHLLDFGFGFLQNGGSVITAAFDLARLSKCSAIGLLGVDLSYPGFQTHSKLTQRYGAAVESQSRFASPESNFFDYLSEKATLHVPKMGGEHVWSDRVLVMYKHWMEDAAHKTGLPCFNLGSASSAVLQGYVPSTPGEFLSRYAASRADIDARLARCRVQRPAFIREEVLARLSVIRRDMASLDTDPAANHVGPYDLDRFVGMASYEVGERLREVLTLEPESQHLIRRQQAARVSRQWVTPFLDRLESALTRSGAPR